MGSYIRIGRYLCGSSAIFASFQGTLNKCLATVAELLVKRSVTIGKDSAELRRWVGSHSTGEVQRRAFISGTYVDTDAQSAYEMSLRQTIGAFVSSRRSLSVGLLPGMQALSCSGSGTLKLMLISLLH